MSRSKGPPRVAAAALIAAFLLPGAAAAFGQSLVRNEKFAWRVLPTDHLDIYFYEEEAFLADYVAEVAEDAYARCADALDVEAQRRIPLLFYMSARHFEQNNINYVSGEGVGGFSEPLKRRIVIPYTGSQRQFEETLTHEMAHLMEFEVLYPTFGSVFSALSPPDWFMEGLAEHVADDWNPEGEMVLRDAVMAGTLPALKDLNDFGYLADPYMGYKFGQSIMDYVAETYGADAPAKILRGYEKTALRRTDDALDDALGIKEDDLSEDWAVWLRQRYWPLIGAKAQLKDFATPLTPPEDRRKYISYFKPRWSPSGELVACLTVKDRFLDIFLVNAKTGKKFRNLTQGYALSRYEYIMYLENGLSWSPDGNYVAFVGKKDTYDQIFILNVFNRKIVRRYNPRFEDVLAPAFSPDGTKVAFAGVANVKQDIYVMDVASGAVTRVTDDFYADGYPSWSPDGKYIYYASERQSFHNIFRIRPDGTDAEQLTFGDHEDISPLVSPDGARLLFTSNRCDGIFNLFVMDLAARTAGQYTDVVTGVMDGAWSPDGAAVAFTAFQDYTYSVWTMPWRDEPVKPKVAEAPAPEDYGYAAWLARRRGEEAAEEAAAAPVGEGAAATGETAVAATVEPPPAAGESVPPETIASAEEEAPPEEEVGGEEGEAAPAAEAETPTVRELVAGDAIKNSRRYTSKWGPDYIYTTFSYTTGGLFQNYSVLGLSDILGAHRIDFIFDLTTISSFSDVDVELDYYYLTRRTSYIFSVLTWQDYYVAGRTAYDERVSGGSAIASYPLNMRNRVDYGFYGYDRLRRYYYNPDEEPAIPDRRENVLGGLASFVRDTSQWEIPYHPTAGTRLDYTVRQTVPSNPRSLYYTEQIFDVRRYIRISRRVSLAFRAVGGGDLGRDPQDFYLGGGDTLRGYSYTQLYGSRFALGNFEFRFPILDYLVWPIEGFAIGGFRSLFFVDLGSAWSKDYNNGSIYPEDRQWYTDKEDQKYTRFTFASTEGGWHLVHPKMAFGTGVRWWFGYFDLKLDWAWRTNLHAVDKDPYLHFTLGSDF